MALRSGDIRREETSEWSNSGFGWWNRVVLEVDDLNEAMESIRRVGGRFRSDPIEGPGGKQVLVEDTSGNPIELFEPKSG